MDDLEDTSFGSRLKNNFLELIEFVAIVAVIVFVVHYFIAEPHQVSGSSMVPNFHSGELIITNKLSTRFTPIKRGEVIVFNSPREPDKVFIKRVIGLPKERVMVKDGKVYINGNLLPEPYLPPGLLTQSGSFLTEGEELLIPDNNYFVLGDNRPASSDSREWGPVNKSLVVGQAWLRYMPVQRFGLL